MSAPYCRLPLTDPRRAWVSSDHTDVAETFRQFETIHVSPVRMPNIRDDYEDVEHTAHLDFIGAFK